MDIPIDPITSSHYLIQFDDKTTKLVPASKMLSLIPKPHDTTSNSSHLLPPFLRLNSKITFEHKGQFHKGYLTKSPEGTYCFSYKLHVNKKHPNWRIPLPNLLSTWRDLCTDGILLPGHSVTSFIQGKSANFVRAVSLLWERPCSLLTALAATHPDSDTWLLSFREKKDGINSQDTYNILNLDEYHALQEKGAPRAILTMCVLTIKPDKMLRPHRAKAWIVVLENHKDQVWMKSGKYAPVLHLDTLRFIVSMAVE
jgi:hypothetical protein